MLTNILKEIFNTNTNRSLILTPLQVANGVHFCPNCNYEEVAPNTLDWGPNPQTCICGYDLIKLKKRLNKINKPMKERINKGISYLNKNYPKWFNKINLNTFDMGNWQQDIVGQLNLHDQINPDSELGFDITNEERISPKPNYQKLTKLWIEIIMHNILISTINKSSVMSAIIIDETTGLINNLEYRPIEFGKSYEWIKITKPSWNWEKFEYRIIKPKD